MQDTYFKAKPMTQKQEVEAEKEKLSLGIKKKKKILGSTLPLPQDSLIQASVTSSIMQRVWLRKTSKNSLKAPQKSSNSFTASMLTKQLSGYNLNAKQLFNRKSCQHSRLLGATFFISEKINY